MHRKNMMARLMDYSDDDDNFPDLAQLILNPRVPLAITYVKEKGGQLRSPRKAASTLKITRKLKDHGSKNDASDARSYETRNINAAKHKPLEAAQLQLLHDPFTKPSSLARLETSAPLLSSKSKTSDNISTTVHAFLEDPAGRVGSTSEGCNGEDSCKPKILALPKKSSITTSKTSETRDPAREIEIIDLTSSTEKPFRKTRYDQTRNTYSSSESGSEALIRL